MLNTNTLCTNPAPANIALHTAVKKNDIKAVLTALENDGNPNFASSKDIRPILFDSIQQDSKDGMMCTKALLSRGANTDFNLISNCNSVLHEAASLGSKSQCEILLEHEENDIVKDKPLINRENSYGNTPLFSAVRNGSIETVKLLLDNGADVNHMNHLGSSVLHLCCFLATPTERSTKFLSPPVKSHDCDPASVEPDYVKIASMIISSGNVANLDLYDETGHTPLHIASVRGCIPLIKLLVESGADLNKLTKYDYKGRGRRNAISMASFGGMKECHDLLLKYQQHYINQLRDE
jgi:ankyrin repeat protein